MTFRNLRDKLTTQHSSGPPKSFIHKLVSVSTKQKESECLRESDR